MKTTRPHPRHALRPVCGAALTCLLAGGSLAQQAPAAAEQAGEVVVTGSRIRGIAPIGAPVVGVARDDIESAGVISTAQLLQQVPQVFNLGVSENSRGQAGGAGNITYGSSVNIRGIGPFATLVLINGHRAVGQGTTSAAVDPSIIPMLMLERVEIVADGASAIYGSDAIAGVANLILRRNEKGVQAFINAGSGDSYNEYSAGAVWGSRWTGGGVTVGFERNYRSGLSGRDRDFFTGDLRSQGGGDFRSTQCNPGNIVISNVSYAIPAGGVTRTNAAALLPNTSNRCDNQKVQDLVPRQERNSLAFTANHDFGDGIAFSADGFVTKREYRFRPAALAANLTVPSTNPFYVRPPGAPGGTNETVTYSFINDLPVNTANGFSKTHELTLGLDKTFASNWKIGAQYTLGYNEDLAVTLGGLNNAAITAALARTDPATALNVFSTAPNTAAALANINNSVAYSPGETRFENLLLKADGPLFALPGGQVRAAFGLERQNIRTVGGQTTGPATAPVGGEVKLVRSVDSVYTEVAVPVVGSANGVPLARRIDLTAAVRHDDYSDVGKTTNPKLGLTWEPVAGFSMRGSYGKSFRAPGLTQIQGFTNGGRGGLFVQNYSDPTNGGALRVGVALSAANRNLEPETATTKTLGFDWDLPLANKTKLSMTYFDIVYDKQIVGVLSDLTVLNREALFAGTGIIQRNPSPELVAQLLAQYPISGVPPATWTLFVNGSQFNLGKSISKGFDFQVSTKVPTKDWGQFAFGINGTVFTKYLVAQTPAAPLLDQLNKIYNPMKIKARVNASWSSGPWFANVYVNHTNAYDNDLTNPVQRVRANTTLDARIAFALGELSRASILQDATLSLGAINLFDKKPPFVNVAQSNNGGGGFDPTQVNPVGRIVSISLDKRF